MSLARFFVEYQVILNLGNYFANVSNETTVDCKFSMSKG